MDWNLAIERHSEALKRILAMLVAMAGLGTGQSAIGNRHSGAEPAADGMTGCLLPTADCRPILPRHLHRAILRLLRPAESAARRLIIVMARGIVVTLAPPRPRKPAPASIFLKKPGGTGILLPPGVRVSAFPSPLREGVRGGGPAARTPSLPLFDPPRRPFRFGRPVASSIPRISFPRFAAPSPIAPRLPPAPDDLLDATRLALRLQALGAALDDLPAQAKRFARWRAKRKTSRVIEGAQNQNRTRRVWPLRPGRPPGQRPARHRTEVHEILNDLHGLAFDVLEHPDTS